MNSIWDGYDRENDKVKLKIIHTYGVVVQSTEIADRMKLSGEERTLAQIIALLHDIGRSSSSRDSTAFAGYDGSRHTGMHGPLDEG